MPRNDKPILAAVFLVASLAAPSAQAADDGARGVWLTADGDAKVRIEACAPAAPPLCGSIVWLREPLGDDGAPVRDQNNPDRSLRTRQVMGVTVLDGMSPAGAGWKGRVYDPDAGAWYDGALRLLSASRLEVAGCRLMLCRREIWRRE